MTTPGAVDVIAHIAKSQPNMIVRAGTVLDEVAAKDNVVVFPGALTPT